MGLLFRNDFSLGWQPSADALTGPKSCLLRADNLVQDEAGLLSLRLGSATINPVSIQVIGGLGQPLTIIGTPIPMVSDTSSVHSLFTTTINGTRYRCAGVDNQAFANFGSFGSFDGSGDIHFGSHQGQILAARGTTKWKWDGTSTRRWGIPRPTAAPSLQVLDPRVIVCSTLDTGESPAWTPTEGTVSDGKGQDNLAGGARDVFPVSLSGRGTIQRVFSATLNYDSFDSGAATGAPEDSIEFYAWISNPELLEYVAISFDVNENSTAPFQDDYYYFEFSPGDATEVKLDPKRVLQDKPDVEGIDRDNFFDGNERPHGAPFVTRIRRDAPSDSAGWSKFVVFRGQMERIGSTPGTNWSTVKAIRFTVKYQANSAGTPVGHTKFDGLRILGGSDRTLTGKFTGRYVWTRDFGNYIAKSGPSADSDEIECRNNGIRLVIPASATAAKDAQLNETGGEAWAFLAGGSLQSFFRFATKSSSASGTISIDCLISERDAIIADIKLETRNDEPPNQIIAIVPPHKNRTIVCTETQVFIGRDGNPDSFAANQVLDVADPSERILWAIKSRGEVFIGTTRDIYSLSGSLAELPDGTMDARLEGLGVNSPPIGEFVINEGPFTVYVGADGFRLLQGASSTPINWNLDLLVEGYTRHGVSPLNLGSAPGRFRGGIYNGRLYVMIPEGTSTLSSPVVYVGNLGSKQWRRAVYPRSFQCVYREPDGKILAGDSGGVVWNLETSGAGDVRGGGGGSKVNPVETLPIPVTLWTIDDDNDQPLQFKEPFDWRAELSTGAVSASISVYLDGVLRSTFLALRSAYGICQQTIGEPNVNHRYKRVQTKITGSFLAFTLGHHALTYRDCPPPMLYWDSGLPDFGTQDLVWFREIQIKARSPVDLKVDVLFDGEQRTLPGSGTVTVRPNVESIYPIDIGKECKGRQPLIVVRPSIVGGVETPNSFELYWVRVRYKTSGGVTEKLFKVKVA